jgi:RNA polymerase sigma-70 factor (ECF subfamily)
MTDPMRPISVETLLAERPWVESLARTLVRSDATAADVVQETWLAALRHAPREPSALRAWLSRVVRNEAFQSMRRAARRERWESSASSPPPTESPEETVARAEAHRRVVDAVMSLDEPYRTAVLLRFFEGLASAEVAKRTGVPVETARTRIKRALALLRGRLDRDHGGDGRAWAIALVPLVGMEKGTPVGAAVGGAIMGMKSAVAGAVVGALLGALVTAAVMKRDEPPVQVATLPSLPDKPRAEPVAPARGSERAAESEPSKSTASVSKSPFAAALDAVEIDPPKAVAGSITGFVRTKDGAGVSGVTIRATSRASGSSKAKPSGQAAETTAETAIRNAVTAEKWRAATQREATTDASGAFSVTGLADGGYWLAATAKGWSIRSASGANDVGPGSSVEYVATAVVDVPVRVVAADGSTPTEQVLVRWTLERGGGGGSAWWKPDSPSIGIEPGTWVLTAEIAKRARSNRVTVTATAGSTIDPVTLQLATSGAIEGVVRFDPPESAWASAEVTIARKGETDRRSMRPVTVKPPLWKFAAEDLSPGEYEVTVASRDEESSSVTVAAEVKTGRTTADIVVPRPAAAKWIAVRVTGPDGAPLPADDVHFCLRTQSPTGGAAIGVGGIGLADGGFLVSVQPRAGGKDMDLSENLFKGAQWQLEVTSQSCGKQALEFEHGKTERLEAKFSTPAKFLPVFENVAGTPLDGRIETMLGYPTGDYSQALNNAIGTAVEPGRYVVYVKLVKTGGTPFDGCILARIPVDLVAGENRVPIRVPELSTLIVRIPGAAKGTEVRVGVARRPTYGMNSPAVAADDGGLVTCPELTAGVWRVSATVGGEQQEMLVRVPAAGEVTFAPAAIAGLTVTVDDASGLLAKAGFQTGDVITAMDGVEIDSMRRLDNCFYGARGHATAAVTVRRGGRDVTLTIDPAKFGVRSDYGGAWEPVLR